MNKKYTYALWRRKSSTAIIKMYPNWKWEFNVIDWDNKISLKEYFWWSTYLYENALYAFYVLAKDVITRYDADITLRWWGKRWQSDSIKLAFSRALTENWAEIRTQLKPYWLLKRDPRIKERKKPWLKKARKSPQWSKR